MSLEQKKARYQLIDTDPELIAIYKVWIQYNIDQYGSQCIEWPFCTGYFGDGIGRIASV